MSKILGRPPKYKPGLNKLVYNLALLGCTDTVIAEAIGISVSTFYEWRNRHKSFSEAMSDGKLKADGKVARALYNRATGFKYTEELLEDGPKGYKRTLTTKLALPDPAAAIRWLEVRNRHFWGSMKLSDEDMEKILELIELKQNSNK